MRTSYCSVVCAFLLEERFSDYFADARRISRESSKNNGSEQKPFYPTIILFLSTFPLFSPRTRYCESPIFFPLASAPTPQREEEARGLFPVVYSRVFFVSSASFSRIARSRPWANVHARTVEHEVV